MTISCVPSVSGHLTGICGNFTCLPCAHHAVKASQRCADCDEAVCQELLYQRLKTLVALCEGSAVRDRALGILLDALAPDEALSQEEAAQKLEAALYASCSNGLAAGPSGQPAEPGVTYMRRLRVLWSWLDSSSPHRSPGLKRLFIEGNGSF